MVSNARVADVKRPHDQRRLRAQVRGEPRVVLLPTHVPTQKQWWSTYARNGRTRGSVSCGDPATRPLHHLSPGGIRLTAHLQASPAPLPPAPARAFVVATALISRGAAVGGAAGRPSSPVSPSSSSRSSSARVAAVVDAVTGAALGVGGEGGSARLPLASPRSIQGPIARLALVDVSRVAVGHARERERVDEDRPTGARPGQGR